MATTTRAEAPSITDLKQRIAADPPGFYGHFLELRRDGSRWQARCPFHADGSPSLKIFTDGGWRCFAGCGGGDGVDFLQHLKQLEFPEALREAADLLGATPAPTPRATTAKPPAPAPIPLQTVLECHDRLLESHRELMWLCRKKGLTLQIIRLAMVGIHPDHWKDGPRFTLPSPGADEDYFPDCRGYRPGAKAKNLPWSAGRGNRLYPWPMVCGGRRFVVCEGEVDCLALLARGVFAVTAHCGVDGLLAVEWPDLSGREFTILGDADPAGDRLREELPAKLFAAGAAKVTRAQWPPGLPAGFDVADWLATGVSDEAVWGVFGYGGN